MLPLEEWANPSTEDPARLRALLVRARGALRSPGPLPGKWLAADFVAFVDPRSPGTLRQVLFRRLDDPAAMRLRREARLPVPRGYVFIRRYLTSGRMPAPVASRFAQHDNAAAMTITCRFVAVGQKLERPESWVWASPDRVKQAVSHEIVHAYVNSLLGPEAAGWFPKWFHEGCALYYGGSLGEDVPPDYREYLSVFQYLRAAKGEQRLARFVRRAVAARSLETGLRAVGEQSQESLLRKANKWHRLVRLKAQALGAAVVVAIASGIIALSRRAGRRLAQEEGEEAVK